MLTMATDGLTVPTLIAINDLAADGRDVSWLWDVDFELLAEGTAPLCTTGIRGADMANRLKYAGVAAERITPLSARSCAAGWMRSSTACRKAARLYPADLHGDAGSAPGAGGSGRGRALLGAVRLRTMACT